MSDEVTMGTLFSGIGAPEVAAADLGIVVKWQSEIDPQASAVLDQRFPEAINLGDVRNVGKHNATPVDILCGGFPCQDLSVAGLRGGLAGERSGLWYEFHRVIFEIKPRIVIIENVDGLLSSGPKGPDGKRRRGLDFAIVLAGLTGVIPTIPQIGWRRAGFMRGRSGFYNVAWRVLDAQYFGVPQRRKRIFIVASLGDGSSAEILFERASLSGGFRPGGKTRQDDPALPVDGPQDSGGDVAGTLKGGSGKRGWPDPSDGNGGGLVIPPLTATGVGAGRTGNERNEVEFLIVHENLSGDLTEADHARALRSGASHSYQMVSGHNRVRRLTPVEAERLQGFTDGHTAVATKKKRKLREGELEYYRRHFPTLTDDQIARLAPDSVRYRQCGNSMAVPVMRWILGRTKQILDKRKQA